MRLHFEDLDPVDRFDICIVGSGPAGVTCALDLASGSARVALIEGGSLDWTGFSQDLLTGTVKGDPFFDLSTTRLRHFGGSSGHWAGWCRSFDAHDFDAKGRFDVTAWPISKSDIDPYLEISCADLEIPPQFNDQPMAGGEFRWVKFQHSPPVRYAEKYGEAIFSSEKIALYLETNVGYFETDGNRITGLRVLSNSREEKIVQADVFILAAGGIENSRILLWSNERSNSQIVKNSRTLGRYWMEHPQTTVGEVLLRNPPEMGLDADGFAGFAPAAPVLTEVEALNCTLGVTYYNRSATKRLVADIACVAPRLADRFFNLAGQGKICGARLDAQWEQEPRFENRVALGTETDALGIPLTQLHWARSTVDFHTVRAVSSKFGEFLAEADLGRVRLDDWLLQPGTFYPDEERIGSHHHMGGTRMAASPDQGVVDRDCKVFGQENLYVAGSSIFPSGGYTNPTLPIVQLAHRLSDHISSRYGFFAKIR